MRHSAPRLSWLFLTVWLVYAGRPTTVAAQSETVVIQTGAGYAFGQALHFSLAVAGQREVEGLTLFLRAPGLEGTYAAEVPVNPASQIQIDYRLDLSQTGLERLAPFTTIEYWWVISYSDGDSPQQSERRELFYEDDQFDWRRLEEDGVVVHWTGGDPEPGGIVLAVVAETLPRLAAVIPLEPPRPLRIYLYPTAGDLRAALRLTGRDWEEGHTDPGLGVILVTAVNPRTAAADLRQTIPHELAHLLLYQAAGAAYVDVPRWFNEGLARLFEAQPHPNDRVLLQAALADATTIPLADLCRQFPEGETERALAYAQSASLLRFLQATYGEQALADIVNAYASGAGCEAGLRQALGITLADLEQQWLRMERPVTPAVAFLRDYGAWLALLLVGFAMAGLLLFNPSK